MQIDLVPFAKSRINWFHLDSPYADGTVPLKQKPRNCQD